MRTPTMPTLVADEILKLRTVRGPWLLIAAAQLVVVGGVSGLLAGGADPQLAATAYRAVQHVGLVSLFTLVFGITAVAGEYRHRTVTDTYLAAPRRSRVLLAKLAVYTATGLVAGLLSAATAVVVTAVWFWSKDSSLNLSDGDLWRVLAGAVLWNGAFAAIGVAVGALVRNLAGAVAAALAWIALVEGIVGEILGGLGRWLPLASGSALARLDLVSGAPGLPQWGAGLVLAGYAAGFAALAGLTTVRGDVT